MRVGLSSICCWYVRGCDPGAARGRSHTLSGSIACCDQPPAHAPRVRHGQATCHVSTGQWSDQLTEMMRAGHRVTTNHLMTLDEVHCFAQKYNPTPAVLPLKLERKTIQRFEKVSIVSYRRLSPMIIASRTQFHIERPWG